MKELSLIEKADAYDRVAKEVKDFFEGKQKMYSDVDKTLEYLFPELKESEDEKIKRILNEYFKERKNESVSETWFGGISYDKILSWLEKQGEQKPAWSEEDEKWKKQIIKWLSIFEKEFYQKEYQCVMAWLESLKDKVGCEVNCTTTKEWKPSDEQIEALRLARSFVTDDFDEHPILLESLIELEEQLKKLKNPSDNNAKPNFKV